MLLNIDNKRQYGPRKLVFFFLGNALPLLLALYGLKCILTLSGSLTEPYYHQLVRRRSFYFAPVTGMAAVMAGLGDIALALFGYLSCGPAKEGSSWLWRIVRQVIRWGSLAATYFLWHRSHELRIGMS
jgi:hypothetical protein